MTKKSLRELRACLALLEKQIETVRDLRDREYTDDGDAAAGLRFSNAVSMLSDHIYYVLQAIESKQSRKRAS